MSLRDQARGIRPNDWASARDLLCDIAEQIDSLSKIPGQKGLPKDAAEQLHIPALQASIQALTDRVTAIEEMI